MEKTKKLRRSLEKMINQKIINQIAKLSKKPALFERGTGNIWTEPYLAKQMLKAHLDLKSDGASRKEKVINKTIDFLNGVIKERSTILDLGCGPGLYAEKLCISGHQVTGVDFSENTIRYARDSAQKRGLDIEYVCDNIFSIDYKEHYDVVVQIYGELNTFSDEELKRLFELVQKALKSEGIFIFEVTNPTHRRKNRSNKDWTISEEAFWRKDSHIVLQEVFEYEKDIWLDQYIVIDENEIKVYRNWFHDYTKEAIEAIILEGGFSQVQVIDNLNGEEASEEVEWLTVIARK